MAAPMSLLMAH